MSESPSEVPVPTGLSTGHLLTDAERVRFARWCEEYAHSSNLLAGQLEKLPGAMAGLMKRHRAESMACSVVAMILQNTESQTIGGG